MPTSAVSIQRDALWEFKARLADADLDIVRLRTQLAVVAAQRNALIGAFAERHGLDATRPIQLDDDACTASQE